jgi:hypothetical protein
MTRLIMTVPGAEDRLPATAGEWDPHDPANISPFVAYLATADCPIKGRVFWVSGGDVRLFQPFALVDSIHADHRWTLDELKAEAAGFADFEFALNKPW